MAQISTALHVLSISVFLVALLYAVVSDARTLEIPNWIPIATVLAFLPAALLSGMSGISIALHYGITLIIFAGGVVLFSKGLAGGGDVKFLAAVCVWWDVEQLGKYLIIVALLGGVLGLITILAGHMDRVRQMVPWLVADNALKQPIPYGIAISGGALIMFDAIPVLPAILTTLFRQ